MKIIFSALDQEIVDQLNIYFGDEPHVEIHHGDIFDHKADAIVSPSNGFGFMDGGIDLVYCRHFGFHVETNVREAIRLDFDGELLVGQAVVVPTAFHDQDHPFDQTQHDIPWLIAAPTMRVPMNLGDSVNVYLAFRAALRAAKKFPTINMWRLDKIDSILCPSLGTGVGLMDPKISACQMKYAFDEIIKGRKFAPLDIQGHYHLHYSIARGVM